MTIQLHTSTTQIVGKGVFPLKLVCPKVKIRYTRVLTFKVDARKRSPVRGWPGKTYRRKPKNHFQAYKKHTQTCTCFHSSGAADGCIRRCKISYDRCAHWYWQTEAEANLWTPEIYETFVFPITITRIVPVAKIDQAQAETSQHSLLQYLHFAFVVKTRLRELGWRWQDYLRLKRSTKPAEARFKNSFGYPLASDRVTFCIWCCPSRILEGWPKYPTRYIQDEVDQEVSTYLLYLQRIMLTLEQRSLSMDRFCVGLSQIENMTRKDGKSAKASVNLDIEHKLLMIRLCNIERLVVQRKICHLLVTIIIIKMSTDMGQAIMIAACIVPHLMVGAWFPNSATIHHAMALAELLQKGSIPGQDLIGHLEVTDT
jgi:hypothetical protein